MKKLFQFVIISLFIISGCKKEKPFLRPDVPARYSITIGTEAIDRPMNTETFEGVCAELQLHSENNGIVCQSIVKDLQKQQITFNVIGLQEEVKGKNYGINFYSKALVNSANLEFYDVYLNNEKPVTDLFISLYDKLNLSGKVNLNLVDAQFPGGYLSASPCLVAADDLLFIDSILRLPAVAEMIPDGMALVWAFEPIVMEDSKPVYQLFVLKTGKDGLPFLSGKNIKSVSLAPDNSSNGPAILITFKPDAAKIWADKTRAAALDNQRPIAILLDDRAVSVPNVISEITGGEAVISGGLSMKETESLINRLKMGTFPCNLKIVEAKKI